MKNFYSMLSVDSMLRDFCTRTVSPSNSALQQWKGGSGKLALPAEGNIVVNPADEAVLLSTAEILADDLSLMMGWNYSVKIGKPGKNDIYMALMKPDKELGDEGYKLSVNRYAGIEAPTRKCSGNPYAATDAL